MRSTMRGDKEKTVGMEEEEEKEDEVVGQRR